MSMKLLKAMTAASFAAAVACGGAALADDDLGKLDSTDQHSRSIGTAISDTAITAKVKSKFSNDSRLDGSDIDVSTANGIVMLKGAVPDMAAKRAATDLARNIDGVVDVDNDLMAPKGEVASMEGTTSTHTTHKHTQTKPERVASDSWITTKVKTALLADSVTKGTQISVKTSHKVVHLSGSVDSQAAIDRARDIARGIKHVKKVDTSGLKVERG